MISAYLHIKFLESTQPETANALQNRVKEFLVALAEDYPDIEIDKAYIEYTRTFTEFLEIRVP